MVFILTEEKQLELDTHREGDDLWIMADQLETATGWTLKAEGFCRQGTCMPMPRDGEIYSREGRVNLTAFWRYLGGPVVHTSAADTWLFGRAPARMTSSDSLKAPDFRLPDVKGTFHALSDFLGKKVLLISWASW